MILQFDFTGSTPLFQQLRNQVVLAIARGEAKPGERLPTIRALSEESGVNMMTISKGYQLLAQEGYIVTDRRNGAVIVPRETQREPLRKERMLEMELHLAELRLQGMENGEILLLCRQLLEEMQ